MSMSKLDYVTIAIVVVCLAALVFLIVQTTDLFSGNGSKPAETPAQTETPAEDENPYTNSGDAGAPGDRPRNTSEYDDDTTEEAYAGAEEEIYPKGGESESTEIPGYSNEDRLPGSRRATDEESAYRASSSSAGRYMVIAGAYRIRENAEKEVRRLREKGYPETELSLFDRGTYAVVLVNRFDNLSSAKSLAEELKREHSIDAYVKEKN